MKNVVKYNTICKKSQWIFNFAARDRTKITLYIWVLILPIISKSLCLCNFCLDLLLVIRPRLFRHTCFWHFLKVSTNVEMQQPDYCIPIMSFCITSCLPIYVALQETKNQQISKLLIKIRWLLGWNLCLSLDSLREDLLAKEGLLVQFWNPKKILTSILVIWKVSRRRI